MWYPTISIYLSIFHYRIFLSSTHPPIHPSISLPLSQCRELMGIYTEPSTNSMSLRLTILYPQVFRDSIHGPALGVVPLSGKLHPLIQHFGSQTLLGNPLNIINIINVGIIQAYWLVVSPQERKKKPWIHDIGPLICVPFPSMDQFKCSGHGAPRLEHVRSPLKHSKGKVCTWAYAMHLGQKLTKHGGVFAHLRLFAAHGTIYSASRPPHGRRAISQCSMEAQKHCSLEMVWLVKAFK